MSAGRICASVSVSGDIYRVEAHVSRPPQHASEAGHSSRTLDEPSILAQQVGPSQILGLQVGKISSEV